MTNLSCNARDCMNNKNNCCCMNNVSIGGDDANCSDETYCNYYKPKREGDVYTMGFVFPNPTIDLECSAELCRHNEGHRCMAESILITRHNKTTNCKTFEEMQ